MEKKIGVISADEQDPLQTSTNYFLVTEAGEKISINSVSVNLKRYKKRRVEAVGKWNDAKTVFEIDQVTSLGQETALKETYQNAQLGMKFQYPSIWNLREEKNVIGLQKVIITPYETDEGDLRNVDSLVIEKSENNKKLSARQWLALDEEYRSLNQADLGSVFQKSSLGIAQLDAVKKTVGTGEEVDFYVARDTSMYRFSHVTVGDSDKDLYRNAFYDLVQSFEFIPFDDKAPAAATPTALAPAPAPAPATPAKTAPPSAPAKTTSISPSPSLWQLAEEDNAKKKAEEEAKKQVDASAQKAQELSSLQDAFITYIKAHVADFAPEVSATGSWVVTKVEFSFPEGQPENFNAVYVTYGDGQEARKILLNVPDRASPASMSRIAYFKPGDTTDWKIEQGEDSAKKNEKGVVSVTGGSSEAIVVKKGMSLLESRSYKAKIQYPSNWYWAFLDAKSGYGFSTKPVAADNVAVKFIKNPESLPASMTAVGDIGGRQTTEGADPASASYYVCVRGKDLYCFVGSAEMKATLQTMAASLNEA